MSALAVGLRTSVYSLVDGYSVRRADAAAHTVIVLGLTALFLAPVILIRHGARPVLAAWRGQAGAPRPPAHSSRSGTCWC